jgi:hypothetical protein
MADGLLDLVKQTVLNHTQEQRSNGYDHGPLFGALENIFKQHGSQGAADRSVRPASEDRYGDPADQVGPRGSVKPASQDPNGDPADDRRH